VALLGQTCGGDAMTQEEYVRLFHKEHLALVAFEMLLQCDKEVLR